MWLVDYCVIIMLFVATGYFSERENEPVRKKAETEMLID